MVGFETSDDAAVYKITDDVALIFTMDFFPAITGDPYMFGQISASNALSDVYAMGAEPRLALNLFCFPSCMPPSMAREILRGGFDKVKEAGCILCGGHTIEDDVPKYGLAVNGFAHPDKILRNCGAKDGDVLILTKPIGSGILTTASKGGLIEEKDLKHVYETMAFLNKYAKDVAIRYETHSLTDITGFGLLGHCYEMAKASNVDIELDSSSINMFPSSLEYARMGILARGVYANREFVGDAVCFENVGQDVADVLFDPQTSGGLLISVSEKDATALFKELHLVLSSTVCGPPCIIGRVKAKNKETSHIFVKNHL